MRSLLVLLSGAILLACSGDPGARPTHGAPAPAPDPATAASPGAPTAAAPASCPVDVPASASVAGVGNAQDLAIVGNDVWMRNGISIVHVAKTGGTPTQAYTSDDLLTAYVDATGIFTVESPNPPDAVLQFLTLDGKVQQTVTPDNWNANGTRIFGADAKYVYVLADDNGDKVVRVERATGAQTVLADLGDPLSDAQLAGTDVWFVRAQKRVYKVAQTDADGDGTLTADTATEIFASGADDCRLAVGGGAAYCSNGKTLVRRDLTGGALTTLFDVANEATPRTLGAPLFAGKAIVMRPVTDATGPLKNVISSLVPKTTGVDEKLAACGRASIAAVAADATSVVWSEPTGVYLAPR